MQMTVGDRRSSRRLQWEYDALGRLTGTRDANGNWQASAALTPAAGRSTAMTAGQQDLYRLRRAFGQKRFAQDPLGYVTFLEYDQAGRVVAQGDFLTEADGQTRSKATRERYTA
jgi:YD repeat-containing protein